MPVHDMLMHSIPVHSQNREYKLSDWRRLIKKIGYKAVKGFADAERIERVSGVAPQDLKSLKAAILSVSYERAAEDQDLAVMCHHYLVPESRFNRILDLKKEGVLVGKESDIIPSVTISKKL